MVAVADTAADAVMLKKKPADKQPAQSFLADVVTVKEVKEDSPKPAAEEKKPEAEAPKPAVEEAKPEAEAPKPAAEAPKPAEEPKPVAEAPKPVAEEKKPEAEEKKPEAEEKKADGKEDGKKVADKKKDGKKDEKTKKDKKEAKEKKPARDAIITADRTDYDRKEGVVLFDRNVYVDDEQYQMHADRLFLFLDGTNDLKRLVAIGHVAITNEDKRAYCARATFNKKLGRVVMYSSDEITAQLHEEGKKGSDVKGEKITFWLDSEQVEVENPVITMPGGFGGQDNMKKLIGK